MPKVMIVDDEQTTARSLQFLLELDDFEVLVAPSGESAIVMAKESIPDAFLVDFHLLDGEGTDFVRQLRGRPEFLTSPIIMASGLDREEEAIASGANRFLIKPFEYDMLLDELKKLLARQKETDQKDAKQDEKTDPGTAKKD